MRHIFHALWIVVAIAVIFYGMFLLEHVFSTPGDQNGLAFLGGASLGVGFPILVITFCDWINGR